jgi:hypothetical protein
LILCAARLRMCRAPSTHAVVRPVRAKSSSYCAPSQPPRLESDPFTALADARPAQDDRLNQRSPGSG